MERKIPNLENTSIVRQLLGFETPKTSENYIRKIEEFEIKCEKSLIETLSRINIKGSVKNERYSLPFKNEIKVILLGESYLRGAFELYRVARPIIKQLLNENTYKLRFYFLIDIFEGNFGFGRIEYKFRYYTHN